MLNYDAIQAEARRLGKEFGDVLSQVPWHQRHELKSEFDQTADENVKGIDSASESLLQKMNSDLSDFSI